MDGGTGRSVPTGAAASMRVQATPQKHQRKAVSTPTRSENRPNVRKTISTPEKTSTPVKSPDAKKGRVHVDADEGHPRAEPQPMPAEPSPEAPAGDAPCLHSADSSSKNRRVDGVWRFATTLSTY